MVAASISSLSHKPAEKWVLLFCFAFSRHRFWRESLGRVWSHGGWHCAGSFRGTPATGRLAHMEVGTSLGYSMVITNWDFQTFRLLLCRFSCCTWRLLQVLLRSWLVSGLYSHGKALLTLLLSHSMTLLSMACKTILNCTAVPHFGIATGSLQCLHCIFCIKNKFEAMRLAAAMLSVRYDAVEQRPENGSRNAGDARPKLFTALQVFSATLFWLLFSGSWKKATGPCLFLLLLSLWQLRCSSCSTACQAACDMSQLPQGWLSLGRADSMVQISRDFELFSGSFKDHSVISLYILQILIKIFRLVVF